VTEKCSNTEKGAELLEKCLLFVFMMTIACVPDYIHVNYFLSFWERKINYLMVCRI